MDSTQPMDLLDPLPIFKPHSLLPQHLRYDLVFPFQLYAAFLRD